MSPESKNPQVHCFGELLLDRFPDRTELGGAPFNVSYGLHRAGIDSRLVSAVGQDRDGELVRTALVTAGLRTDGIGSVDAPTGEVRVFLDNQGQPAYRVREPAAWDYISFEGEIRTSSWLYFGTLAQRAPHSRNTLRRTLSKCDGRVRRYCDLNLRPGGPAPEIILEIVQQADVLKLNECEYRQLEDWGWKPGLREGETVIVTRGEFGASMRVPEDGLWIHLDSGPKIEVVDSVGAGDAFSAAFLAATISRRSPEECLRQAIAAGSRACRWRGATDLPSFGPSPG